jgi:hypothetical protein
MIELPEILRIGGVESSLRSFRAGGNETGHCGVTIDGSALSA